MRVAAGLANPGRSGTEDTDVAAAEAMPATIVIFSDGGLTNQPNFSMGNLTPVYRPIGNTDAENVGIVAFSSGQSDEKPEELQIFARLQNFGSQDRTVTTNLTLDGSSTLLDAAQVKVPAGGIGGVEFVIDAIEAGELKLTIDEKDELLIDNEAYAAVNPRRRARVLFVSPRNDALETVLATTFAQKLAVVDTLSSDALDTDAYKKMADGGAYDLIIYDQCRPEEMPQCNTYFIGILPPDPRWTSEETDEVPQIIDVDQSHPLMRFVEMGNVKYIVEGSPLKLPPGGTMLIDSHLGAIMGIAPREGFEDLVQGFEIVGQNEKGESYANTDWPIRTSFPIFIGNVLTYLGGSKVEAAQVSGRPGQPIALRTRTPVDEVRIIAPDKDKTTVHAGAKTHLSMATPTNLEFTKFWKGTRRMSANGLVSICSTRSRVTFGPILNSRQALSTFKVRKAGRRCAAKRGSGSCWPGWWC